MLSVQAAHVHGYESSLCAGVDSDGMVQGSLLEDVLTKKRMVCTHYHQCAVGGHFAVL